MRYFLFLSLLLTVGPVYAAGPVKLKSKNPDRVDANLYLPKGFTNQKKWPLIVSLHGFGGSSRVQNYHLPLEKFQRKKGFMYLVPTGLKDPKGKTYWNASNFCCDFFKKGNDDVAYIKDLINQIRTTPELGRLNEKRIYVIGYSNGSFLANTLACRRDITISGIVSISGTSDLRDKEGNLLDRDTPACAHSRPIPVFHVHATEDETIKYGGDDLGKTGYLSALAQIKRWGLQNSCQGELVLSNEKINASRFAKGKETDLYQMEGCKAPVEFYSVNKEDHFFRFHKSFIGRMLRFLNF